MGGVSRRNLSVGGAAACSLFAIGGRAHAADFTYKLGLELLEDQPLPRRMIEACKVVLERTNGRMRIRPFPNAALGSSQEMLTQVRSGALELLTSSFGLLSSVVPVAGLPTLGFIFDSPTKIWPAIDGALGAYIAQEIEKRREIVVISACHDLGFRQLTTNKGFALTPADLRGLKVRTPQTPYLISLFSALGASPTPIPFPDLYTALQTGLVDAQENPLALVDSFKFYEVQKFCTLTSHTWDGWLPVANQRSWARLPEDIRAIITTAFNEAALLERQDIGKQSQALQAGLVAKGMKFHTPEPGLYRDALRMTDFYPQWKAKVGDEAWSALERSVGLLG